MSISGSPSFGNLVLLSTASASICVGVDGSASMTSVNVTLNSLFRVGGEVDIFSQSQIDGSLQLNAAGTIVAFGALNFTPTSSLVINDEGFLILLVGAELRGTIRVTGTGGMAFGGYSTIDGTQGIFGLSASASTNGGITINVVNTGFTFASEGLVVGGFSAVDLTLNLGPGVAVIADGVTMTGEVPPIFHILGPGSFTTENGSFNAGAGTVYVDNNADLNIADGLTGNGGTVNIAATSKVTLNGRAIHGTVSFPGGNIQYEDDTSSSEDYHW